MAPRFGGAPFFVRRLPGQCSRATIKAMKLLILLLPLLASLLLSGCRLHDVRTIELDVPGMRCEACGERVVRSLAALEGVEPDRLSVQLETGKVSVRYDSMVVAIKNLEFAVASAGYRVEARPYPIPADPAARESLPPECREHIR